MRKGLILLFLLATPAYAQQANNNTPVTRTSEHNRVMKELTVSQQVARLVVTVRDSGGAAIRDEEHLIPDPTHPTATIALYFTALDTVRSGEPAGSIGRANYRSLGYLSDHGYLPPVTLQP